MLDLNLRKLLAEWAETKPNIKTLYVFGSRARGTHRIDSDLDLAFEFVEEVDNELSELIEHASSWKKQLTESTGLGVKDVYLHNSKKVGAERVAVFCR